MRFIFMLAAISTVMTFAKVQSAAAEIKVHSATNVSRLDDSNQAQTVIYGGLAGRISSIPDVTRLYNSCLSAKDLEPCNESRIFGRLRFTISVSSDVVSGYAQLRTLTGEVLNPVRPTKSSAAGETTNLTFTWNDICRAMSRDDVDFNCDLQPGKSLASIELRMGVATSEDAAALSDSKKLVIRLATIVADQNGLSTVGVCEGALFGICHFELLAGPGRVRLWSVHAAAGFPNGMAVPFTAVRLYWIEGNQASLIRPNQFDGMNDLEIRQTDGKLSIYPSIISGLTSGKTYAFKLAMVDAAGNLGHFTADSADGYCKYATRASNCHVASPSR